MGKGEKIHLKIEEVNNLKYILPNLTFKHTTVFGKMEFLWWGEGDET